VCWDYRHATPHPALLAQYPASIAVAMISNIFHALEIFGTVHLLTTTLRNKYYVYLHRRKLKLKEQIGCSKSPI
jgi:hypothetical protein